jgi:hypothetical protein
MKHDCAIEKSRERVWFGLRLESRSMAFAWSLRRVMFSHVNVILR